MMQNDDRTAATSRVIRATPDQIFAVFRDPERLARWWGPDGFTNTFHEFDFQPGGKWKFTMHGPEAGHYQNESTFAEVVPNERIVIRHLSQPHYELTVTLEAVDGKTRLGWSQQFETADMFGRVKELVIPANEQNLNRLEAELVRII